MFLTLQILDGWMMIWTFGDTDGRGDQCVCVGAHIHLILYVIGCMFFCVCTNKCARVGGWWVSVWGVILAFEPQLTCLSQSWVPHKTI